MTVISFEGERQCNSLEELNEVLELRSERDNNDFILIPNEDYPNMEILIKGDWTYIYYFPEEDHAGFFAYMDNNGLDKDGDMEFNIGSFNSVIEISNEHVIPVEKAYEVAREYFASNELSKEVKWFEL